MVIRLQKWLNDTMTNETQVTCPKCGAEIPLTEAVSHRIREELSANFEKQRQEQNAVLAEREGKLELLKKESTSACNLSTKRLRANSRPPAKG